MRKRTPHRINEQTNVEEKFCPKCNVWNELQSFNKKTVSWDGLETKCINCARLKSAKFRQENPQFDKDYQNKNRDKLREYKRQYYHAKKAETKAQLQLNEALTIK